MKNPSQYPIGSEIRGYKCIEYLGAGSFGKVYKGISKDEKDIVALKFIQKSKLQTEGSQKKREILKRLLKAQIQILQKCNSEQIMRYYDKYQNQNQIILILQYCNDGDLMKYIKKKNKIEQEEAVIILRQIILGLNYLHRNLIIHRDLKPQNIFIHNNRYKIGDLGFAKIVESEYQINKTVLGTPKTMAPEVTRRQKYGIKADLWSLGMVYYQMLYGKTLIDGKNYNKINQLLNNQINFSNISQESKDFLQKILVVDIKKRMNWTQVYNHQLLKKYDYIIAQKDQKQLIASKTFHDNLQQNQNQLNRNPQIEFQQIQKNQEENIDQQKIIQNFYQKINSNQKFNVSTRQSQQSEHLQQKNEIDQILMKYKFQFDKSNIIYNKIINPMICSHSVVKDRTYYEFLYLITCRQQFTIQPIYKILKNPINIINKDQNYQKFFQQVQIHYNKITELRQTISLNIFDQQNKIKARVLDFCKKWAWSSWYSEKDKYLCGIEGIDFKPQHQIQFMINYYYPQIKSRLQKACDLQKKQKEQIKYFLENYKKISLADYINQKQLFEQIKAKNSKKY